MKRKIYVYSLKYLHADVQVHGEEGDSNQWAVLEAEINEPLDTLLKNGCHLVSKQIDLPKPLVQAEPEGFPAFPRTDQDSHNLLSYLDISHLEKAVDQWQAAGYVDCYQCQHLTGHLNALAQASDKLHQAIRNIRLGRIDQAAVARAAKK